MSLLLGASGFRLRLGLGLFVPCLSHACQREIHDRTHTNPLIPKRLYMVSAQAFINVQLGGIYIYIYVLNELPVGAFHMLNFYQVTSTFLMFAHALPTSLHTSLSWRESSSSVPLKSLSWLISSCVAHRLGP